VRFVHNGLGLPQRGPHASGLMANKETLNRSGNLTRGASYVVKLTTGSGDDKRNSLVAKFWTFKVQ
jgi:hypothetical protein